VRVGLPPDDAVRDPGRADVAARMIEVYREAADADG
jgi:hypothetical protein